MKPFKRLTGKLPGNRRKRDRRSGNEDGGEVDVEGSEAGQKTSYLAPEADIDDGMEGGRSREWSHVDRKDAALVDDLPTSTPSISQGAKLTSK